jgi:nicotinamidase-related amidase
MKSDWGDNPALLVVDVSRKRSDPSLETSMPGIVTATERIADLLSVARGSDIPIVFTNGGKGYYTSGGVDLDDRGPWPLKNEIREESREQAMQSFDLAPALDRREGEELITKRTPSAFFDSPLAERLNDLGVDTLIITGIMTSCCVRATVEDAFAHEYPILLPEDCIADRRPAAHGFHLNEMGEKFADVVPWSEAAEYVRQNGA